MFGKNGLMTVKSVVSILLVRNFKSGQAALKIGQYCFISLFNKRFALNYDDFVDRNAK